MAGISSSVGLVSGINSKDIIDQLMSLEAQPKTRLEGRIEETNKVKLAYTDLSTRLTSLKLSGTTLKKSTTFQAATTTSGDDDVLTAIASNGAAVGNYQFQVARLVTTQQSVSSGFTDVDKSTLGAGTITIEQGGGELTTETLLSQLNGGAGVRRGSFRITDRSGKSAVIELGSAVSLNDVMKKINTSLGISVRANASGEGITLTDLSGSTLNNFTVQDLGDGHAAADLGIVSNVALGTITGTDINSVGSKTLLEQLNDGRGVRRATTGADFTVSVGGTNIDITLGTNAKTVADVVAAINAAGGIDLAADVAPGANNLRLTDKTAGGRTITVTAIGTSQAAKDLGFLTAPGAGTLNGKNVISGVNTVSLGSLKGGAGLTLGSIQITDRAGASQTIDLSAAKSVQDVLDAISNAPTVAVTARLKKSGNGIEIVDDSGGVGNIVIAESGGGTSAADLGILGTFDTTVAAVQGANLQRQWVNEATLLSNYNGGKGIAAGHFKITNAAGATATVDLSDGAATKLSDVIAAINSKGIGVTASINANGDGLLLTDASGGAGKMKVEDVDSTTAKGLNILGAATTTPNIDGSLERTITVEAGDTLTDVQRKITNANAGVTAGVLNDGSGVAPYRLSLTSRNSGHAGRVVIDTGALTALQTTNLVEAQDAAVFLGNADAPEPLLITSGTNQITGVVKGVTIDLHGVSDKPVNLGITRTADGVVEELKKFTDNFNDVIDKIKEYTKFDTETNERGLLLGDTTIQQIEQNLYEMFGSAVSSAGRVRVAADVGLKLTSGAKLEFDEQKFLDAYAADADAVATLFSKLPTNLASETPLTKLNSGKGVRTAAGGGADFSIGVQDGTSFNVTLAPVATLGELLNAINTAGAGKVTAKVSTGGVGIEITDNTTGVGTLTAQALNGSNALIDLGLPAAGDGVLTGKTIFPPSATQRLSDGSGLGYLLENSLSRLIDPIDGTISKENKNLDAKNEQFQSRIDSLDKLLAGKRERLERQFSQMESVLSGLQSQQQSLSALTLLPTTYSRQR